jgi:hypothetical protein
MAAAAPAATPAEVDAAIKKGRAFLLSMQNEGNWEKSQKPSDGVKWSMEGGQWGGVSALVTYALLAAGEKPQSPKMQEAIEFVMSAYIEGVYALGMRAQLWQMVPRTPQTAAALERDTRLLLQSINKGAKNAGLYHYWADEAKNNGAADHSVSQYGVLGSWAVEQAGATVPQTYWTAVEKAWVANQDPSGGWCYAAGKPNKNEEVTLSMTAAGVATLFITQDYLHAQEGIVPKGNIENAAITKGLDWIGKALTNRASPDYYTWYGVERIGVASGRKYIGEVDWFKLGAERLVRTQSSAGSWNESKRGELVGTSFALLFLSRGRAPVMMNKLEYEVLDAKTAQPTAGLWNQRPREVANLARWVGKNIEGGLNWQVTKLKSPLEDLLEAPILYISGGTPLTFSEADQAKLKEYVEAGGIIYGNADGGHRGFADSFQKLGESLFPPFKFRKLPDDHVIYTNQQYPKSRWPVLPDVMALGNGAREFMIISPTADYAKFWQQAGPVRRPDPFQLPANIFLYSVDKQNLRFKGETYFVTPDTSMTTTSIKVARLKYDGAWDPEPGGWRRQAAIFQTQNKIKLETTPVTLGDGNLAGTYRIAHLTGVDEVKFSESQRKDISEFVSKGGTLIVDAAGGRGAFATSIEAELVTIFGGETARKLADNLPPDHAIYKAGSGVSHFEYRPYVRLKLGSSPRTPQLRGLEVNGRLAVLYTPMDLSVGMVGQHVDGIYGYDSKTATAIMTTLLQYASANR